MSEDRRTPICTRPDCSNDALPNHEYCYEHDPTCATPGCDNTAEFHDNFLCLICNHKRTHEISLDNEEDEEGRSRNPIPKPCSTNGCNQDATIKGKCYSCNQTIINEIFTKHTFHRTNLTDDAITDGPCTFNRTDITDAVYTDGPRVGNLGDSFVTTRNEVELSDNDTIADVFAMNNPNITDNDPSSYGNITDDNPSSYGNITDDGPINFGNIIFGGNRIRTKIVCIEKGCRRDVATRKAYCEVHERSRPVRTMCASEGCLNIAELPNELLCIVCLRAQRIALNEIERKRSGVKPVFSSCPNIPLKHIAPTGGPSLRPGNANFNLKELAKCLPPVPLPKAYQPDSSSNHLDLQNSRFTGLEVVARGMPPKKTKTKNNSPPVISLSECPGIDVLARGMPGRNNTKNNAMCSTNPFSNITENNITSSTNPFANLPPVPMLPRSNSAPGSGTTTSTTQIIQNLDVTAFSSRTTSAPDCRPTSVHITISTSHNDNNDNIIHPGRRMCKGLDCRFFVNEGLGDYCSNCFMCYNISENVPPSPPPRRSLSPNSFLYSSSDELEMEEEYVAAGSRIKNQLCRGRNCEFFGSDAFDGYCSGCYKHEGMKRSNEDIPFIKDEDDKMCIICLSNVYNTVLLPCGHLYLCFECASKVKTRGRKCPACRSHIQSFHRVYMPD